MAKQANPPGTPEPQPAAPRRGRAAGTGSKTAMQRPEAAATRRVARDLAYVEVTSTELSREINRDIVLELIRARQPVARVDLARASGLQNSTVSSIVEQLLAEGWIREGEALKTARGRRPTQIALNEDVALLVADVHEGRALIAAVDLNGRMLARSSLTLTAGPRAGVRELGAALRTLRESLPGKTFEGVGVTLPGRIDAAAGRLMLAPNLDWLEFPIRDALERELKLKVELENDANACLLAELWFGHLDGIRNAVLLAISEGVGASLLADGHLISGLSGLAGEFGHVCYDPAGPKCGCGRRGCWEVFASSSAARRYYTQALQSQGKQSQGKYRAKKIDYAELCRLALSGDAAALSAIRQQATAIGRGLRLVTATLSPETILFTGEITSAWPLAEPILNQECRAGLLGGDPPRLASTGDGEAAHLLGAAAVVLQRHTGYYRSRNNGSLREHGRETRS